MHTHRDWKENGARKELQRTAEQIPVLVNLGVAFRVVLRDELVALDDIHLALNNAERLAAAHHFFVHQRRRPSSPSTAALRTERAIPSLARCRCRRLVLPSSTRRVAAGATRPSAPREANRDPAEACAATSTSRTTA